MEREKNDRIWEIAERNQRRARELVRELDIVGLWQRAGARVNLIGSLRTGLLVKHRDIDFHVYSPVLSVKESLSAIAPLLRNPSAVRLEYANGIRTDEKCIEWHLWVRDRDGRSWQIDMIHIQSGSFYDGYFEKAAERITALLTPQTKETILRLKYETPEREKVMGIEYCRAVLQDGVRTYGEFVRWREEHPVSGVSEWMP